MSPHFCWQKSFATNLSASFTDKKVQWPILNNSHDYPFCKTMPGTTSYLVLAIAPFLSLKYALIGCETIQSVKVRVHHLYYTCFKPIRLLFELEWAQAESQRTGLKVEPAEYKPVFWTQAWTRSSSRLPQKSKDSHWCVLHSKLMRFREAKILHNKQN